MAIDVLKNTKGLPVTLNSTGCGYEFWDSWQYLTTPKFLILDKFQGLCPVSGFSEKGVITQELLKTIMYIRIQNQVTIIYLTFLYVTGDNPAATEWLICSAEKVTIY